MSPRAVADAGKQTTPEVCDIIDVSSLLKCSPRHVDRLVEEQKFPAPFRVGKLRRWRRQTVLAWMENGGSIAGVPR
jgi:excisionase family DNA binding protein